MQKSKRILPLLVTTLFILSFWGGSLQAAVISPGLEQAMQNGNEVSFIVRFSDRVNLGAFPAQGQGKGVQLAALIHALHQQVEASQGTAVEVLQNGGARHLIQLWSINALAATATGDVIQQLSLLPGVKSITLDATFAAPDPIVSTMAAPEWNLNAVHAPELWSLGYTGSGIVVAGMDTGVDVNHQDLASRWRGGNNSWFDPNNEHATPNDSSGHGTQTMGLIVGGDGGGTAIGMAPGAQWIAVKIFNDAGIASLSGIHQGFQWLLDPDGNPATNDAPDVVNNSWGFPNLVDQCYVEFETDIELLKTAGVAVVFSGGNTGPATATSVSPANNSQGFAVGSIDSGLSVASTSARGPSVCDSSTYPEVVAPGVNVRTADLTAGGAIPNSYVSVSGTSAAAPHISGAMALLREAYPNAAVIDLEQAIETTATDLGQAGADNDYGNGLVDVIAASDFLANLQPPACTDIDGDGFYTEANCGTELDCNDSDATINPLACDIKRDGIDQDCDGLDRRKGKSCPVIADDGGGTGGTGGTGGVEGKGSSCSDGVDNDGDGLIDCLDPDCSKNRVCRVK